MKNFLSGFFYFNKKERRGIYFLIIIITLIGIFNLALQFIIQKPEIDFTQYEQFISHYDSLITSNNKLQDSIIQYFNFDPNKLKKEEWLQLGLNPKQAQVIINYRNKGGVFKTKEDFQKIYSIDSALFSKLNPFISLPEKENQTNKKYPQIKDTITFQVELNSTDSIELIKIKGIGPVFASRIIKYRDLIGGYISVSQLQEVYGIDSLKYDSLKDFFLTCNIELIQHLNINVADFKDLLKHPYISYDFTKDIVNRRQKKVFDKAEDAFNDQFISDSLFQKLLPYLTTK
ncbi:MAG: helix-hairpin-helix domain-containing protein [Bacteroidetes bacterium]|nr:helix-hairpin-helix domain-containing protein [Bacteroidota bacterium]